MWQSVRSRSIYRYQCVVLLIISPCLSALVIKSCPVLSWPLRRWWWWWFCRTTYAKVAGKYQDVLTLEQSVAELHQMFLDFALLTEQQGELLDQIEFQVKQAGDYVEEANVDVHQAIEYQKSIRKKQCWLILIVVVVVVALLFGLGILPPE